MKALKLKTNSRHVVEAELYTACKAFAAGWGSAHLQAPSSESLILHAADVRFQSKLNGKACTLIAEHLAIANDGEAHAALGIAVAN